MAILRLESSATGYNGRHFPHLDEVSGVMPCCFACTGLKFLIQDYWFQNMQGTSRAVVLST
eukprot:scaffold15713_cov17-Prasinocladus_malaysianus.AAC.1